MIDFKNAEYLKLKATNGNFTEELAPILLPDEKVVSEFKSIRDGVVFTNKRIIAINIQGVTGKKKDLTSLPYSKIQAFSCETAGVLDLDSEAEFWFSGLGKVRFEFTGSTNISAICKMVSQYVL